MLPPLLRQVFCVPSSDCAGFCARTVAEYPGIAGNAEVPKLQETSRLVVAGGLGFEPRLTESESVVLPLDDPPSKDGID